MFLGLLSFTVLLAADLIHEPCSSRVHVLLGRLLQAALIYCKTESTNSFTATACGSSEY